MKNSTSDLFDLIKSLTDGEVKAVYKEIGLNEETNKTRLFDYLLNASEYDVNDLFVHFKGLFNEKNLPPTKSSLRLEILSVLRELYVKEKNIRQLVVTQQADFIEILRHKNLYGQALDLSQRMKKSAEEEGQPFNKWLGMIGETAIMQQYFGLRLKSEMVRVVNEMQDIKTQIVDYIDVYSFYIAVTTYNTTNALIRSEKDYEYINSFKEHPVFKVTDFSTNLFYHTATMLQARAAYYLLLMQWDKALKEQEKLWAAVQLRKHELIEKGLYIYIDACINYISVLIVNKKVAEAKKNIDLYRELTISFWENNPTVEAYHKFFILLLALNAENTLSSDRDNKIAEDFFEDRAEMIAPHLRLGIALELAIIKFTQNDFDGAMHFSDKIFAISRVTQSYSEIRDYNKVFAMLIYYERDRKVDDYFKNYIDQYIRTEIGKHKNEYPFELIIAKFFLNVYKTGKATRQNWRDLRDSLLTLKDSPDNHYAEKLLMYFDIIAWADGKAKRNSF